MSFRRRGSVALSGIGTPCCYQRCCQTEARDTSEGRSFGDLEATAGFEPANRGFADLRLGPLGYVAPCGAGCPSRIRTSVFGSKVRCPTAGRRGKDLGVSVDRAKNWSGRRDSNPRPSPWQGDALPTEPLPLEVRYEVGAESQIRTGDTAIFSRVLYQLSYLGPMWGRSRPSAAGGYHASCEALKATDPARVNPSTVLGLLRGQPTPRGRDAAGRAG